MAVAASNVDSVYTFRQNGNILTGSVESSAQAGFGPGGGGGTSGPIEDSKIDGSNISFRAGNSTYAGTINGEQIELRRSAPAGRGARRGAAPAAETGPRPTIGPPPDGSDPSFGTGGGGRGGQAPVSLALRRARR